MTSSFLIIGTVEPCFGSAVTTMCAGTPPAYGGCCAQELPTAPKHPSSANAIKRIDCCPIFNMSLLFGRTLICEATRLSHRDLPWLPELLDVSMDIKVSS